MKVQASQQRGFQNILTSIPHHKPYFSLYCYFKAVHFHVHFRLFKLRRRTTTKRHGKSAQVYAIWMSTACISVLFMYRQQSHVWISLSSHFLDPHISGCFSFYISPPQRKVTKSALCIYHVWTLTAGHFLLIFLITFIYLFWTVVSLDLSLRN